VIGIAASLQRIIVVASPDCRTVSAGQCRDKLHFYRPIGASKWRNGHTSHKIEKTGSALSAAI
jgi:hypothetical protein